MLACHPDVFLALDGPDLRVGYANRAAAASLRFASSESIENVSFHDLLDDDSRRRFRGALQAVAGRPPRSAAPLGGPLVVGGNQTSVALDVLGEVSEGLLGDRSVVVCGRPLRKRPRA